MTAMTGDKGEGHIRPPFPYMDKVAKYFGRVRVKEKYKYINRNTPCSFNVKIEIYLRSLHTAEIISISF